MHPPERRSQRVLTPQLWTQATLRLSPEQHGVLLSAAEAMAGRLRDIAAQQQGVLARVRTLNRGTMPMTTGGIHPDLVRHRGGDRMLASGKVPAHRPMGYMCSSTSMHFRFIMQCPHVLERTYTDAAYVLAETQGHRPCACPEVRNADTVTDVSLQLESMKLQSLVIVDQHATVNT